MSWKNYDTDEVLTDKEMEEVCTECICFCSEGTLPLECDGIKENCPYYKQKNMCEVERYDNDELV